VVELDLSLAELVFICRACAWLRIDQEPGDWFRPFLVLRVRPWWPALAERLAHFDGAELQALARLIRDHQRAGKMGRPGSLTERKSLAADSTASAACAPGSPWG
jgi:hypothetical protein